MRIVGFLRLAVAALTSAGAAMTAGSPAATAQGLFDYLLGGGPSYPQQHYPANPGQTFTTPGGKPYQFPSSTPQRRNDDDDSLSNYGKYRTLCVRMCDGYYFPISASTSRKGFARDEARCQASCSDARLFHVPANQSVVDGAIDSDGRHYVAMKTAFLYRKKRIDSCQCRQAPWSEAELNRHRTYADAEAVEKPRQPDTSRVSALAQQSEIKPSAANEQAASTGQAAEGPSDAATAPATLANSRPTAPASRADRIAARTPSVKPQKGRGPVLVNIPAATKPPGSAAFAAPMALGGGAMHWPGDPPPVHPGRKR